MDTTFFINSGIIAVLVSVIISLIHHIFKKIIQFHSSYKYKNIPFKWWARILFSDIEMYALNICFRKEIRSNQFPQRTRPSSNMLSRTTGANFYG